MGYRVPKRDYAIPIVTECSSLRPILLHPPPRLPLASVSPPRNQKGGWQHSLVGERAGGANSDERESLALCLLYVGYDCVTLQTFSWREYHCKYLTSDPNSIIGNVFSSVRVEGERCAGLSDWPLLHPPDWPLELCQHSGRSSVRLNSMRIQIQYFWSIRLRIQIQAFDDEKLKKINIFFVR
jgi:hypothetical protein